MAIINDFRARLGMTILLDMSRQWGGTIDKTGNMQVPKDRAGNLDMPQLVNAVMGMLYNHSEELRDAMAKVDTDDSPKG